MDQNVCFRDIYHYENHCLGDKMHGYQETKVLKWKKNRKKKDNPKIKNVEFSYKRGRNQENLARLICSLAQHSEFMGINKTQ